MKPAVMHQPLAGAMLGLSPRQMDTLDADVIAEHAAHEARVLAEAIKDEPMSEFGSALFRFARDMNRSMAAIHAMDHDGPASSVFDSPILRGAVTTDDAEEIATLVDQMAEEPHRFAERYVELERRFRALEASHKRIAHMVQGHEVLPIHLRRIEERVSGMAGREIL